MSPADQESSYRAIERLIATYAELVDDGDFAAVGRLLADATFTGGAGSVSGRDAIEKMLRDNVIVYDDGTPRTKHVTTNLAIEVDEEAGTAVSRSYFTVLQALPDLALQPDRQRSVLRPLRAPRGTMAFRGEARPNRSRRRCEPPSPSLRRRAVVLSPRGSLRIEPDLRELRRLTSSARPLWRTEGCPLGLPTVSQCAESASVENASYEPVRRLASAES